MRYLVISDVHGNFPALQRFSLTRRLLMLVVPGRLVGYGPNPNQCIQRIQEFPHICVAGNHDWRDRRADVYVFNQAARDALSGRRKNWSVIIAGTCGALDVGEGRDYLLVHGSPREPIWEYLLDGTRGENFMAVDFALPSLGIRIFLLSSSGWKRS